MGKNDSQETLKAYIKDLDRLRWEYLRESDKYRQDWELCKQEHNIEAKAEYELEKKIACGDCEKELCDYACEYFLPPGEMTSVLMSGGIDTFHIKAKDKSNSARSIRLKIWQQYGINFIANPDLDYHSVIALHPFTKADRKLLKSEIMLFYSTLHEYGIYEGIYTDVEYKKSPFLNLTVNMSLKTSILADEFRRIIAEKKKAFDKVDKNKLISKKWLLPKNVHIPPMEEALEHYRLKKYKNMSYTDMASHYRWETGKNYDSMLSLVRKNVLEVKKTIKNVENGIFP